MPIRFTPPPLKTIRSFALVAALFASSMAVATITEIVPNQFVVDCSVTPSESKTYTLVPGAKAIVNAAGSCNTRSGGVLGTWVTPTIYETLSTGNDSLTLANISTNTVHYRDREFA